VMLTSKLYESVLIDPADQADRLTIVSGYASAAFARRHLSDLRAKEGSPPEVRLIIGMEKRANDHLAFVQLHEESPNFTAYYLEGRPPVHSKVYAWSGKSSQGSGFAGSANYSQYGFFENEQINQMSHEDPLKILNFFEDLLLRCVPVLEASVTAPVVPILLPTSSEDASPGDVRWEQPDKVVRISFLEQRKGKLPKRSGLNWGQRPELGRAPNQAYLSLKKDSKKEGFLPPRAIRFTLITDDGQAFDCVRAQQGDKAIHTTDDNSLLGAYIRDRIGVASGVLVRREDLERYGRTDFTLSKLDDETFMLDLSVPG